MAIQKMSKYLNVSDLIEDDQFFSGELFNKISNFINKKMCVYCGTIQEFNNNNCYNCGAPEVNNDKNI